MNNCFLHNLINESAANTQNVEEENMGVEQLLCACVRERERESSRGTPGEAIVITEYPEHPEHSRRELKASDEVGHGRRSAAPEELRELEARHLQERPRHTQHEESKDR
eukprot:3459499-Rhodomonas_salina.1